MQIQLKQNTTIRKHIELWDCFVFSTLSYFWLIISYETTQKNKHKRKKNLQQIYHRQISGFAHACRKRMGNNKLRLLWEATGTKTYIREIESISKVTGCHSHHFYLFLFYFFNRYFYLAPAIGLSFNVTGENRFCSSHAKTSMSIKYRNDIWP